jgi:hypothetical protein
MAILITQSRTGSHAGLPTAQDDAGGVIPCPDPGLSGAGSGSGSVRVGVDR